MPGGGHLPRRHGPVRGPRAALTHDRLLHGEDLRHDRRLRGGAPHPDPLPRRGRRGHPQRGQCFPFAAAPKDDPRFAGTEQHPTVSFLGRLDEPRKGLAVLAAAIPAVLAAVPGARFLIAGRGEAGEHRTRLAQFGDSVVFLGGVSDADKAAMLASSTCYVAPQTGGESFGIVLVEAMAAGTRVIASDLTAFSDVLEAGRLGALFRNHPRAHHAGQVL